MDTTSKEYQKFVLDYTIERIMEEYKVKTKKEAKELFWKSVAYNVVQSEIIDQIDFILKGEEEDLKEEV